MTTITAQNVSQEATVVNVGVCSVDKNQSVHLNKMWAIDNLVISTDGAMTQNDVAMSVPLRNYTSKGQSFKG